MGGYGSGRPAYKSQGTVEQFTRLHIRDLGKLPLGAWAVESGGQKVGLAWLTGTKGGAYPLLVCPKCEQNRRALYRVGGWWQCRVCGRLACHTQEEIAEAVDMSEGAINEWIKDFLKISDDDKLRNPADFDLPIYNVWKQ